MSVVRRRIGLRRPARHPARQDPDATEVDAALKNGVGFTTTMLLKDTSHRTVFPVWQPGGGFGMKELEGAADVVMLPDPTTFRALPWAPHSGWMLCDIYFADGRPMPLARAI
jgi:glutamine synthetase